jgi:hypothetical protein
MKAVAVNTLTRELVKRFSREKISAILYVRCEPGLNISSISQQFEIVNVFDNIKESSENSFDKVTEILEQIRKSVPGLFFFRGYDLGAALEKEMFWGMFEQNAVSYTINGFKNKGFHVYDLYNRPLPVRVGAMLRRAFIGRNYFYSFHKPTVSKAELAGKIAFRVNDRSILANFGALLHELGKDNIMSFQTRVLGREQINAIAENFFLNMPVQGMMMSKKTIPLLKRLRLVSMNIEPEFKNVMLDSLFRMTNHIRQYEKLFEAGVTKVVVMAAENEGEGNVFSAVAERYGVRTYNGMNGAKADVKWNRLSRFDFWFMPDEETKKLIRSYGQMSDKQLPVTGHLMEDLVAQHTYKGSLDFLSGKTTGKKIISFFTSILFVQEQAEVLQFLQDFLEKHRDCIVLIRRHPRDKTAITSGHPAMIELPQSPGQHANDDLFDLLQRSTVTISFSSTVSLQSSWTDTCTINYEASERSRLPFVDGIRIKHVSNLSQLDTELLCALNKPVSGRSQTDRMGTAKKIATILRA